MIEKNTTSNVSSKNSEMGEFFNWLWKAFILVIAVRIASGFMTSDAFQRLVNP